MVQVSLAPVWAVVRAKWKAALGLSVWEAAASTASSRHQRR